MYPSETALRAVGQPSSIKCVGLRTCASSVINPGCRTCKAAEQMETHRDSVISPGSQAPEGVADIEAVAVLASRGVVLVASASI
jgi:hypothetical protein